MVHHYKYGGACLSNSLICDFFGVIFEMETFQHVVGFINNGRVNFFPWSSTSQSVIHSTGRDEPCFPPSIRIRLMRENDNQPNVVIRIVW